MKSQNYFVLMLFALLASCTPKEDISDIPFNLQHRGLQKKIEKEVIEKMEGEIVENMLQLDSLYRSEGIIMPCCFCIEHNCTVKRNLQGQILVRHEYSSFEQIREAVYLYHTANERLTAIQIDSCIRDVEYEFYSYPFYSRISRDQIETEIEKCNKYLNEAKKANNPDLIAFHDKALLEWKKKQKAIIALNTTVLLEIHSSTHVKISDQMNQKGLSPLTKEAILGIIDVRDYASRKYFNMSYLNLYFNATRYPDEKNVQQLAAIDYLYKCNIVDQSYSRLNGLKNSWDIEESPIEVFPAPLEDSLK